MTTQINRVQYIRPKLTTYQLQALFCPERYSLIEASTKSGKTVGALVWLLEQALHGKSGQNYWWIAPIYAQAKIAYRRMKAAIPQASYSANETQLFITLVNGAIIWFKGADKPDSLYGEDVYAAVIDEASRVKQDAWTAVRSTLTATQGPVRAIGNVRGRKNWFYRMARRAEGGDPDMHYARITAYDAIQAGILSAEEIEDARRTLPETVFKELYEAVPSDDEGNPFGVAAIRACIAPMSSGQPRAYGVDLAKSVDWTVIHGLDAQGYTCQWQRFQSPWHETMGRIKVAIKGAPALVDSTGVGDPILEALQRQGGNYEGYHFTSVSKQQLMEGLGLAIQQQRVHFPEGPIVTELENFEYVYTKMGVRYSAPEGMHDDCVCALALATHKLRNRGGKLLYA